MNMRINTPATRPAASIDFDTIYGEVVSLVHELRFLVSDLEHGLDPTRGKPVNADLVSLMLPKQAIDATLWLAGSAWSRASALEKLLLQAEDAFGGKAVQQ